MRAGYNGCATVSVFHVQVVLKIAGSARSHFFSADAYGTYLLESEELIFEEFQKSKNPVTVPLRRQTVRSVSTVTWDRIPSTCDIEGRLYSFEVVHPSG